MAKNSAYDLAVALEYNEGQGSAKSRSSDAAPKVTIKASQEEAGWLVKTARQLGVAVIEDGSAAEALSELPLDEEISEDLYQAVAIIMNKIGKRAAT